MFEKHSFCRLFSLQFTENILGNNKKDQQIQYMSHYFTTGYRNKTKLLLLKTNTSIVVFSHYNSLRFFLGNSFKKAYRKCHITLQQLRNQTKLLLPKTKTLETVMSSKIFGKRCDAQFTKAIRIGDDTDDSFVIVLQLL